MIRLGVIGLGTIFQIQARALSGFGDRYRVTAVCDVLPDKIRAFEENTAALLPGDRPAVYTESGSLFADPNVDAVLIATPPASHYALSLAGLGQGKDILLEKPAVLEAEQLTDLYREADRKGCLFHVAYHASFAADLEWFLENRSRIGSGRIRKIECGFYDPYMENGRILPAKIPLAGCFIDSGVNALSVCARLTDLSPFRFAGKEELTEDGASGLAFHADHVFRSGDGEIVIHTGWDLGLNRKTTAITYGDREIFLDHSNQSVILRQNGAEEKLFVYDRTERLLTHYTGVFRDFEKACAERRDNRSATAEIHRLLLHTS